MSQLILVKHALPVIIPGQPSHTWRLGSEGQRGAQALAAHLTPYLPARLSCSAESKAAETAAIIGAALGLTPATIGGLEEQHRATASFLGPDAFQQTMAAFFAAPDQLVFGEETADAAYARFGAAIDGLVAESPDANHIVVAHGTVIALFVGRRAGVAPLPLWRRLGLPSFVVVDRATMRLVAEVGSVEP
jgi:broad specificity phosphatase PhoE